MSIPDNVQLQHEIQALDKTQRDLLAKREACEKVLANLDSELKYEQKCEE